MPTYEFESDDGIRIERHFDLNRCPRTLRFGKRTYRRVVSMFSAPIKLVHRAVGDDERIAGEKFRAEGDAQMRATDKATADFDIMQKG